MAALVRGLFGARDQGRRDRWQEGSAAVEAAFALPVLLVLVFGLVGVSRLILADIGVAAVAREAARAAAISYSATEAHDNGLQRAKEVAPGYLLTNGSLQVTVDPGAFQRGGTVLAQARYTVTLTDLPLLNWSTMTVSKTRSETIDPYQSRWPSPGASP